MVILAGARLSHDGERIAEITGLGKAFVGAIVIAAGTSLPEMATTGFAVSRGTSGLALGDLFGTLMLNVAVLAGATLAFRGANVFKSVSDEHAIAAALVIGLCAIAAVGTVVRAPAGPLGAGWEMYAIVVAYLGGAWLLHRDRSERAEHGERGRPGGLGGVAATFALAAVAIVVAASFLASSARALAEAIGLSETFFGVMLLSVITSLPEATVAVTAIARGAHGIGIGAILGSNAFDVTILAPLDVIDGPGRLLERAGDEAVVSLLFAIMLMAVMILAIVDHGRRRVAGFEPLAVVMLAIYAVGLFLTWRAGG